MAILKDKGNEWTNEKTNSRRDDDVRAKHRLLASEPPLVSFPRRPRARARVTSPPDDGDVGRTTTGVAHLPARSEKKKIK